MYAFDHEVSTPRQSYYAHVPLPVLAEAAHEASKMPFVSLKIGCCAAAAILAVEPGLVPGTCWPHGISTPDSPPPLPCSSPCIYRGTEVARPYQMASACKPEPPPASLRTVSGRKFF